MLLAASDSTVAQREGETRELERLQELLEQRTRELEAANERLQHGERLAQIGTLAAGIAHEINNPIGVIILAATNALEISGEPDADTLRDRSFEKILNHCARVREIVNSVRTFASTVPAEKRPYSLNQIVRSAVTLISGYAKGRGISCEVELTEPLPQVPLIPREMEQVFVNLIRNAIETGDRGTRVTIQTEGLENAVRGIIRDCGSRLTDAGNTRRTNVASALTSPSDDTAQGLGSAQGLETVREIVDSYGGSVDVENKTGCITTFVVTLPCNVTG